MTADSDCITLKTSVSYTHLDVYKRQGMVIAKKIVFEIRADSDCITLKNMKKSHFAKSVCVCVSCLLYTSRCV